MIDAANRERHLSEETAEWIDPRQPLPEAVLAFLNMAAEIYFPFPLANAEAFKESKESFSLTPMGRTYEQSTPKYQTKCLNWMRQAYGELTGAAKERVDAILGQTNCLGTLQA